MGLVDWPYAGTRRMAVLPTVISEIQIMIRTCLRCLKMVEYVGTAHTTLCYIAKREDADFLHKIVQDRDDLGSSVEKKLTHM